MTEPDPGIDVDVVVVGAGPTGTAAAIELGRRGVTCLVLDRWHDVYDQPRAVHLDDEVHRLLERLGVAEEFARVSRPAHGLRLVTRHGRCLGELDRTGRSEASGYHRATMFDQPDLETILRRRLADVPSVTLRGGVEVEDLDVPAVGPVTVHLRDVAADRPETVRARYVLGCDGANSTVRDVIGSSMRDLGFEQRWLVVDVDTDADLRQWEGVHQVCDTRRAATYMRIGERRYRWEFRLLDGESADHHRDVESLLPLIERWVRGVDPERLRLVRVAEYTFAARIADRWRHGPVFLLGDAAHLTPPFIGQGMGAGLRDAGNLAWKLADVLQGRLDEGVLAGYEQERAPHAEHMIGLARLVGLLMTGGGRAGDLARHLAVPALVRAPVANRAAADSTTPALTAGPLVVATREDRLAGTLCPNVEVDGRRLDTWAEGRWLFVTTTPPSPRTSRLLAAREVAVLQVPADTPLHAWLTGSGARAAVVRPDGTVLSAGPAGEQGRRVAALLHPRAQRRETTRRPAPARGGRT